MLWSRDIDRDAPVELLEKVSAGTGTPLDRVIATTLVPYVTILGPFNAVGYAPWIPALKRAVRSRVCYGGIPVCTMCIQRDCYFKREWRLAFVATCKEHEIFLTDKCESCHADIRMWQQEHQNRPILQMSDSCSVCGAHLWGCEARPANIKILRLQCALMDSLKQAHAKYTDSTREFFESVRWRAHHELRSGGRIRKCGIALKKRPGIDLERLTFADRISLLHVLAERVKVNAAGYQSWRVPPTRIEL